MPGSQGICWQGLQAAHAKKSCMHNLGGAYVDEDLNLVSAGDAWLQSKG